MLGVEADELDDWRDVVGLGGQPAERGVLQGGGVHAFGEVGRPWGRQIGVIRCCCH